MPNSVPGTALGATKDKEVLSLLRSKIRCLAIFRDVSVQTLEGFNDSDPLPQLKELENRRESLLKAMDLFDRKLAECVDELSESLKSAIRPQATEYMNRQDVLYAEIASLDARIMLRIEAVQDRVLEEIKAGRKAKEGISKFKSTWVSEAGEELDQQL